MHFEVSVPASSANLGPGFDSIAIALSLYTRVRVHSGENARSNAQKGELAGADDLVLLALERIAAETGRLLPSASIEIQSCIPVARGLGSSAAAIVAGMITGNRLLQTNLSLVDLLEIATGIEEHADNLAAALFGGCALAVPVDKGQSIASPVINLEMHAVVFVPDWASLTVDARAALPTLYPRSDAVFNASRCGLLVHALASGSPELLREAMRDRIHQPYRAALYPHLTACIEAALSAGAFGASLSGAGPAVIAFSDRQFARAVGAAMEASAASCGVHGWVEILNIDRTGAQVRELERVIVNSEPHRD